MLFFADKKNKEEGMSMYIYKIIAEGRRSWLSDGVMMNGREKEKRRQKRGGVESRGQV